MNDYKKMSREDLKNEMRKLEREYSFLEDLELSGNDNGNVVLKLNDLKTKMSECAHFLKKAKTIA